MSATIVATEWVWWLGRLEQQCSEHVACELRCDVKKKEQICGVQSMPVTN
jgi:hypothetical protein